nr:hypothetical protein HUO10_006246 [Paraburkholderia busanensis]
MFRLTVPGGRVLASALIVASTAVSTAAVAGEHYVEIWNPPEARLQKPAANVKGGNAKTQLAMRHTPKVATRRIADPVARALPGKRVTDSVKPPVVAPRATDIPRIITPEGNVLSVKNDGAAVEIVR